MPEYPDIEAYLAALRTRVLGRTLAKIRIASPFILRTVDPPPSECEGRKVEGLSRLGKRVVIALDGERFVVIHLMIAGRLRFRDAGAAIPGKIGLAALDFDGGTLILTEAGSKKRASIHLVRGEAGLGDHDPGGLEVVDASLDAFRERLVRENRTLKRALTDPRTFSGIGNAYSDEILHRARLSPTTRTRSLDDSTVERLWRACRETLVLWRDRFVAEVADGFPEKVTAFRDGMAVHGRHGRPCPECGDPVQRVRYADSELNYCATCQTGGRVLADRGLSRLLGKDWPRTLDELERLRGGD